MAVKFDIKEGRLTIKPETLVVSAFSAIWEWDEDPKKTKALPLLKFVFYMSDITSDNPYIEMSEADRERLAKRDCWKDEKYKLSKIEQKLFNDAQAWYETLNQTLPWRSLRTMEKKIDQINSHLDETDITKENIEDQAKTMLMLDKLHQSRENVEDLVQKQLKKMKVRGGLERSPLERGLLNIR
jgi:hypothetical protein